MTSYQHYEKEKKHEDHHVGEGRVSFRALMSDSCDLHLRSLCIEQVYNPLECRFVSAELAVKDDDLCHIVDDVSTLILVNSKRVRDFVFVLSEQEFPSVLYREVEDRHYDCKSNHLLVS